MTYRQIGRRSILRAICALVIVWAPVRGEEVPASVEQLIRQSCADCHHKQGESPLDLTAIAFDLDDTATFKTWEKVYD